MRRAKLSIYLLFSSLFLIVWSCSGEPKIDTSTEENMKSSIERVRQSLPEEQRSQFDEAIQILAFSEIEFKDILSKGVTGVGTMEAKMKEAINGKTGREVITAAEEVKRKRKEKEKVQALQEIKELEEKKASMEKDKKELAKFEVLRSRFYKLKGEFRFPGGEPIIELTVKNGTQHAVSRAYFIGTLASPDRSVPWLKESFNYSISGGLEPGEQATWKLAPNIFSEWGKVNAPKDAVLTVEVERLDGADGQALYSLRKFTEDDEMRLNKLKKQFSE